MGVAGIADAQAPEVIRRLQPMTAGIQPITDEERGARREKARRLMHENSIGAVIMEPGSSMFYFTGRREDILLLPARGEPVWIDSDQKIAQALKDRGLATGRTGIEERVRFAVFDALRKQAPAAEFVIADPVTAGCRMIKAVPLDLIYQP